MPTKTDPWRQKFHLCPPVGLLNDPNGLVYWKGAFHVFFQWNPYECKHDRKAWAHVLSTDLVHWEWLPSAISPEQWYETHGCYSGSAVVCDDELLLIYTGNVKTPSGARESYQCLARSSDGVVFEKFGPVIDTPTADYTAHFRDPKVWRENDEWLMVLGAQTNDLQGTVLLFRSPDLKQWTLCRQLLKPGAQGYMYECPDLFSLDGRDLLIFCAQSVHEENGVKVQDNTAGYVAGEFSGATGKFAHGAFRPLDHGPDFYAPQTLEVPDGRRLMFGWMGRPEVETAPTVAQGWMHCLTLPRQLHWDGECLRQHPASELQQLRREHRSFGEFAMTGDLELPGVNGQAYELEITFADGFQSSWSLDLRCGDDEFTRLSFFAGLGSLVLDKRHSGNGSLGVYSLPLASGRISELRIFVDCSSIEVFVNRGEGVLSARIYPSEGSEGIRFKVGRGSIKVHALNFWAL